VGFRQGSVILYDPYVAGNFGFLAPVTKRGRIGETAFTSWLEGFCGNGTGYMSKAIRGHVLLVELRELRGEVAEERAILASHHL
jgi:hypothetical protein